MEVVGVTILGCKGHSLHWRKKQPGRVLFGAQGVGAGWGLGGLVWALWLRRWLRDRGLGPHCKGYCYACAAHVFMRPRVFLFAARYWTTCCLENMAALPSMASVLHPSGEKCEQHLASFGSLARQGVKGLAVTLLQFQGIHLVLWEGGRPSCCLPGN